MSRAIMRVVVLILMSALAMLAQTNTGSITGTVFDQQKAVVPGVKVTATNVSTNVSRSATTTGAGSYTIPALVPGSYKVTAEMTGFGVATQTVEVVTTSTATLDFTISVGQTATAVTVSAEAGMVQQANASVQYSITPKQIEELPIPNQSVLNAITMLPGVVGEAGTEQTSPTMGYTMPGATLSASGGRMGTMQYKADGVDNTSMYYGSIAQSFSSDAIQEVQVQMNTFSAEYGRAGGGTVIMTTKSGTNELHGILSSFSQNDALNAAPYTNTYRFKGIQRLWRGTGNVGGPVYLPKIYDGRNRTFFFFDYEPLRQSTNTTWYERTFPAQERTGDFSGLVYNRLTNIPINIFRQWEFNSIGTALTNKRLVMPAGQPYPQWVGNKIPPSLISPIGKKLVDLFPAVNYVNPDPSQTTNYVAPMGVNNVENRYLVKWDQTVTNANRMSFRYSVGPAHGKRYYYGGKNSLLDMNSTDNRIGTGLSLSDTHTWGGNKVNELRLGFNRSVNSRLAPDIQNSKNWFKEFGLPSRLDLGMPKLSITDVAGVPSGTGTYQIDNTFQLNNIFSWMRGRHGIKIGFDFNAPQMNLRDLNSVQGSWSFASSYTNIGSADTAVYLGLPTGSTTGRGAATLLLGFPSGISMSPAVIPYQYRWKYYAGFLQDDFKFTPRLTLNLGVRYQVEVPRSEKHNNQGTYVDGFATTSWGQRVRGYIQLSGLGAGGKTMFPTRYNNIEPRIGFAYRLEGLKWLKVMRGGYGISHTPTNGLFNSAYPNLSPGNDAAVATGGQDGGPVQVDWNPLKLTTTSVGNWPVDGVFADLSRISSPAILSQNVAIPYVQQYNFGFGFEFGQDYGLELLYVGSKGTQLFGPARQFNTVNEAEYERQYISGLNMSDTFPNPDGLLNTAGNVIMVSRTSLLRPIPTTGTINSPLAQGHNSNYNSMQAQLVKRYAQGVQFNLNYTFSKSLDTTSCEGQFCGTNLGNWSNSAPQRYGGDRKLERSVSAYDLKHNLKFSFNGELPFGRGKPIGSGARGVLNQIIGNWKVSGIGSIYSGRPWTAFNGSSAGFPDDTGTIKANWAPGVTGCIVNPTWHNELNNAARQYAPYFLVSQTFVPASRFTIGNTSRFIDQCRMPWSQTLNASVLKEFPINERFKAVLRVEAFSVLNHVNFIGNVNSNNVFTGLNYTNYVNPPVVPVTNIVTNYSSMNQNIGPQRTLQVGLKLYF